MKRRKVIESTGSSLFNRNWTLLGAPCVTCRLDARTGLAPGYTVRRPYDDDARVLQVAEWVKQKLA